MIETPHNFVRGRLLFLSAILSTLLLATMWQGLSAQEIDPRPPDLTNSEKSVDAAEAQPGDTLRYTIEVSNEGTETAFPVTVTDALPTELHLITDSISLSGGGTYTYTGNVITWTGAVNVGVAVQLSFDAQLTDTLMADTWITNTAYITGTGELFTLSAGTMIVTDTETFIYMPYWSNPIPMPPTPSLAPVSGPSADNEWTLNWSVNDNTWVEGYTIEESHDPDFTDVTSYDASGGSRTFSHSASYLNTYYYRVRSYGAAGPSDWSQVRVITGNYRDDFKADYTGWTIRREDLDDTENYSRYQQGHFVLEIDGRWDYAIGGTTAMRPLGSYAIETSVRMEDADNLNSYGIIWGADWNGQECGPAPDVTDNCYNHYYRLNIIWFGNPTIMHMQLKRIDQHDPRTNSGRGPNLIPLREVTVNNPAEGYQVWRVEHHENGDIRILINGNLAATVNDDTYFAQRHFGVFASSDEYLGSEPWFDWYTVSTID